MELKDLPAKETKDWKTPDIPEDRHLTTDVITFSEFLSMRKRIGGRNALTPKTGFSHDALEKLRENPAVKEIEDDYVFSSYSTEPDAILFLEQVIEMFKPRQILELGAGLSTLVLAAKQKEIVGDDISYATIEQSAEHAKMVMEFAKKLKLDSAISLQVSGLCQYKVGDDLSLEDKALPCYDLDEEKLHETLKGMRPDMVIIDGPVDVRTQLGASMAKTLTLPILANYAAPGALFVMDGCYMDPEIFAMEQWQDSGAANVIGVKAVGKGMMLAIGK